MKKQWAGGELDVVLTANSPGEVALWLQPVLAELQGRCPQAEKVVFVPPCMFASGLETDVISRMGGDVRVYGPARFVLEGLLRGGTAEWRPGPRGVVLFLGGDLMHAALLARRFRFPALAYTEGRIQYHHSFRRFLFPDKAAQEKALKGGLPPDKAIVVGNLMLDAVRPVWDAETARRHLAGDRPWDTVVALFPGSRPFAVRSMVPFLLRTAELVGRSESGIGFLLSASPFISESLLASALENVDARLPGSKGQVVSTGRLDAGGRRVRIWDVETEGGVAVRVVFGCQHDVMSAADLAVTVPGSNTTEMAFLGLPMVVVLPLNDPAELPLEGVVGMIGGLPLLGRKLKGLAVQSYARRMRYIAHPNRIAGEEIVPEVKGILTPEDVAIATEQLVYDNVRRQRMARKLKENAGQQGAARRVVDHILAEAGVQGASSEFSRAPN